MNRLVIYGAGGFGHEVLTTARMLPFVTLADDAASGGSVIPPTEIRPDDEVVIAIADSLARRKVADSIINAGNRAGRIFAPTAVIGDQVEIGEGAIVCDFAMVTSSVRIGRHFHANIYSYVAHDCVIGDFVTFAPKVCCNGNVHIEDDVYVGTGAIIRNGTPGRPIVIGRGAVIGMGAVITRSVPAGAVMIGNPARPMIAFARASPSDEAVAA